MKPLTMSEEREALVRETHGECNLHRKECGAFDMLAEVDALRAKLAEVEAERDAATIRAHLVDVAAEHESAFNLTSLAASQARERELREALTKCAEYVRLWHGMGMPTAVEMRAWKLYEEGAPEWQPIRDLLSRPTDDSALRELCKRVAEAADANPDMTLDEMVNEVLGPGAEPISATQEKE